MNTMKIGVLNGFPFPEGLAATTRIIAYCKGLVEAGVECEIYTFSWHISNNLQPVGVVENIPYFIGHVTKPHRNKLIKYIVDRPQNKCNTLRNIYKSHKHLPFDFMLVSWDNINDLKYFLPRLQKMNIKLIFVSDEYPDAIRRLKEAVPESDINQYRQLLNYFCGRILMTKALQTFYDKINSTSPTCILSSIVDVNRFNNVEKKGNHKPYLCYMGNFQLAKDNVDNIVKAFSIISKHYPDHELLLYGAPSAEDRRVVQNLINELHMNEKIKIMGRVDYKMVPEILANADVLVASQPVTKRAEGGFPTKMAEYMMTGVPTILTDVGEIHEYITDGVNAYMVEPMNPKAYAEKLDYILTHRKDAESVAQKGKDYILSNYSSKAAGLRIKDFLNTLMD